MEIENRLNVLFLNIVLLRKENEQYGFYET